MTLISTLHDAIVTKIATNLSSYKQLPNPYIIEENNKLYLTKGFGVAVGPGAATNRDVGKLVSWTRIFNITLINGITTTEHNTTSRETVVKNFLEDHYTVMTQFQIAHSLAGNAISAIAVADTGVEYIEINDTPFYTTEIELELEYMEDLTSI